MSFIKVHWQQKVAIITILCYSGFSLKGQSLPVGTPVLDDYYRRAQLLGKLNPSLSFTSKPFFPVEAFGLKNGFDPDSTLSRERKNSFNGKYYYWGNKGFIQLLPMTWRQQLNTDHPYSINDGAMIPARGYQSMINGGFFTKCGPLSIQFYPEIVFTENKPFKTFTSFQRSDQELIVFYNYNNIIDLPEYFAEEPYKRIFWGQSSIRITIGPFSAGISSENLWWGPGTRNSLLMTNTASGFNHFTLNTVKPVKTLIGSFEGQIIGGRIDQSGFYVADTNLVINDTKLYRTKRNERRYLNGMVLTYQPKWVPGLFLGMARSFMVYQKDMGRGFFDYLPIFSALEKKRNYGEGESSTVGDQLASVFIRWLLQKDHAEIYFEYGREDHAYNLRDMIIQPDYSRAYILGLKKVFCLNDTKDIYLQANLEVTQLEVNMTNIERAASYVWYTHIAGIWHGYTNQGQLIGAGIGPGSGMQTFSVSWCRRLKSLGIQVERYVHNNDFFYQTIKDIRAHWVDFNMTAFGEYNYRNYLFSASFGVIRSLNYQYNYQPVTGNLSQFWIPGKDFYNLQGKISVLYRF